MKPSIIEWQDPPTKHPNKRGREAYTEFERMAAFLSRFVVRDMGYKTPCWMWTAGCNKDGYGEFRIATRRNELAHRCSYKLFVGPIPDGLQLDHLCRVRSCMNWEHVEPVTTAENTKRGNAAIINTKPRCPCGREYDYITVKKNGKTSRHCKHCLHQRYLERKARNGNQDT